MAGDLKSHVEEHHKDAALAKKKFPWMSWSGCRTILQFTETDGTDRQECHSFLPVGIPLTWVDKEDISDISDPCSPEGDERPI